MKKDKNKHVYKVGDRVTIKEPKVVVRVGYPLSLQEVREEIEGVVSSKLMALFKEAGVSVDDSWDINFDRALNAIARAKMRSLGFGGNTRSIHTKDRADLAGKTAHVASRRVVKTGTYHRGSTYGGFDGYDYDPPYLDDVRTHVLLLLSTDELFGDVVEIEECNVEPCAQPSS